MPAWSKKKYLELSKGYMGQMSRSYKKSVQRVEKGLLKAYKDRRRKRRIYRRSWILAINSATREHSLQYSRFICGLNRSNVKLDRKSLSMLAIHEPYSFKAVVDEVKIQAKIGMLDPAVSPISFYEALAQKNLIYGSVRPEEGVDKPKLPYIRLRENLDPKLKEQFVIDHSENAISDEANWMFRLLKK